MKKFFAIMIALSVVFCAVIGFADDTGLVSSEELLKKYDLPETEYVEGFIQDYQITADYLKSVDVTALYYNYVACREIEKNDFMYLLETPNNLHTSSSEGDTVTKVLWFWNPNSRIVVFLYDLENRVLYYGDYNILHDISGAESRTLSDADCEKVMKTLEENNVYDWEAYYPSSVDNSTGWLFWNLTIEYNDGSVFQSSGSGSKADNLPATYSQLRAALQEEIG